MSPDTDALAPPTQLFATLIVSGQDYCIDIQRVRENRRWAPITTLPHSPDYMMGTMNLRGEVIPIIDLATLFGLQPMKPNDRSVIVIVEDGERIIGLFVQAVRRILSVEVGKIREAPGANKERGTAFVRGLITSEDDMIRIINLPDVVNAMDELL